MPRTAKVAVYAGYDVDWQGRATATAVFTTEPGTWPTDYTAYTTTTSGRRELAQTDYDDLGRAYQTRRYKVIASTGAANDYFKTDCYYDRNGRRVATAPAYQAATETAYDAAGRAYQTRTVTELESTKYASGVFQYRAPAPNPDLSEMKGGDEGVIQMSHAVFDAGGRTVESHTFEMNHNDTTNVGIDLSANDDYVRSTVFSWHDAAGRLVVTANYGCDDGDGSTGPGTWTYVAVPTRASTVPSGADQADESNDTLLISTYAYDAASGRLTTVTTPGGVAGSVTATAVKTFYDDLGRKTFVAENYTDFSPPSTGAGGGSNNDQDKVTRFVYNGLGNVTELVAMNATTGDQSTKYLYEDSYNAALATNTIYPDSADTDSTGTDQVKVSYYLDGAFKTRRDQNGNIITYVYDAQRRLDYRGVTQWSLGNPGHSGRAIRQEYDALGRVEKITSYANADATGTVINQIQYEFDDLGRKTAIYEEHNGQVNTQTTLKTQFAYDDDTISNVFSDDGRLSTVTYPSSMQVEYEYGATDGVDDLLDRAADLEDGSNNDYVAYRYNGAARPVLADLPTPDVKLDYYGDPTSGETSGVYAGFDRFGQVKNQWWNGYNSTADAVQIGHGYDYAGNRIYREDAKAASASVDLDEYYAHDGLDRLANLDRGALNAGKTAIGGTPGWEEDWSLDELGNWNGYDQKTAGSTTLDQARAHNKANEITQIDSSNAHVAYDRRGDMSTMPIPGVWNDHYHVYYDPFYRLSVVTAQHRPIPSVADYEYDGLNRRILKFTYASGTLVEVRHYYYNDRGQCIQENLEGIRLDALGHLEPDGTIDANPICRYVWGDRYIDELILRQRDTDDNGTLDETLYALQDANFNVVALAEPDGDVVERFIYNAYGRATALDPDFTAYSGTDYLWDYLYTGRQLDRESGLMYYRGRYYHTVVGRFVSRDPIGYRGSKWNLYEYVGDRPIGRMDPLGLSFTPSANMFRYLAYTCKGQCSGKDTTAAEQSLTDGEKEASKPTFGSGPPFGPGDVNPSGHLNAGGGAASALRHCIASGLLAKRSSCECSACVGDNRELFQYLYGGDGYGTGQQARDVTNRTMYNNAQGRLCAGCSGSAGNEQPSRQYWQIGEGTPRCPNRLVTEDLPLQASEQDIIDCCTQKLQNGELVWGNHPNMSNGNLGNQIGNSLPVQPPTGTTPYTEGPWQDIVLGVGQIFYPTLPDYAYKPGHEPPPIDYIELYRYNTMQ